MNLVNQFEKTIANFYGSTYAVAVDCCTHAIELCLRLTKPADVTSPKHTYLSVPMTFEKLNLSWAWHDTYWKDYYYIGNTNIIDAAVYWKRDGYIDNTLMCLSFQYKKHLNIGRGGMILLDRKDQYEQLLKMRYDGRTDDKPWAEQDIDTIGIIFICLFIDLLVPLAIYLLLKKDEDEVEDTRLKGRNRPTQF